MPQLFGVADDQDGLFGVPDETPTGGIVSGVVEPIRAMGSGISRAIGGGLSGIAAEAIPGGKTGAEMVESVQSGAFTPQTQTGQRNLQYIGDLAEYGIDLARFPISGIGGLIELLSGQGTQQAADTVSSVQEEGVGVTAGERVFEETGSPLAATLAQVAPEGIAELAALKGGGRALKSGTEAATNMVEAGRDIFPIQTPNRQRIAGMIEDGSTDRKTAGYRIEAPKQPLLLEGETAAEGLPATVARPKAIPDPLQNEAIRQGFDSGIIAPIREATPETRKRLSKMTNIMQRGKENLLEESSNRASDVAGDSALERFNVVMSKNREAGQQIEAVAKGLKGQPVDANQAVNGFLDRLDSLGIQIGDDLKPNFKGSDIEGLTEAEGVFNRLVDRMANAGPIDAYELHRLKMYIDENVTWGKGGNGLSGKVERVLKDLRVNIDSALDGGFPEYDRVNTQYSDTINVMNDMQTASGRKIDLSGNNANKALGTSMRKLLSNQTGRQEMLNTLNEMESVATKYGGNFSDDLMTQVLFADELDKVFGTSARTSLAGQAARQVPTSQSGLIGRVAESVVGGVADKVRNVNQDAGFKAMRDLLNSFED
jgi:hypothetical protein